MEKEQFNNEQFVLYSPDSLKYITDSMDKILLDTFEKYKSLFEIETFRKIQINYFDDIEKFRKYIYDLRKEKESLPKYAKGTFDNGMINAYIETNIDKNSNKFNRTLFMASHELFHIMYQELILQKEKIKRIIWFDEGMAQFFSGEFDMYLNEDNFPKWFNKVLDNTKEVPNLNLISHGEIFENDNYSGYDLSLLSIKYLYDSLGKKQLKQMMHSNKKIEEYGSTIVNDAINYYKEKLKK